MSSDSPDQPSPPPEAPFGELERLRAEHDRLQGELETIQTRLTNLSTRLETLSSPEPRRVRPRRRNRNPGDDESLHARTSPVAAQPEASPKTETPETNAETPTPEPPMILQEETGAPATLPAPGGGDALADAKVGESLEPAPEGKPSPPPIPESAQEPQARHAPREEAAPEPEKESFETRWLPYLLPRLAVVLFLLFLAFAGNYAYQEWVVLLGPATKVAMLGGLCVVLLGLGKWLERFESGVRRFGSVLGAGGLAGLYYVIFAAHYTERLRVIESPVLAGVLLLAWALLVFYLAERRASQFLALAAVALAYLATAIGPVGWFSAGSNLLLAVCSVLLQRRHRWTILGAVSLVGVYLSFFCNAILGVSLVEGTDPLAVMPTESTGTLITGLAALTAYWITFAAASFFSRPEIVSPRRRLLLLTANNVLWVGLAALLLARLDLSAYAGEMLLGAGVILLITAAKARWLLPVARPTTDAYLAQGLAATTGGLLLVFSGPTQALVLAVELLAVLYAATATGNRILRDASLVLAPLVTGTALLALEVQTISAPTAWTTTAILLFSGWWAKFHGRATSWRQEQVDWFSANGLAVLTCTLVMLYAGEQRLLLLAAEFAIVLLFAVSSTSYLLRVATHLLGGIVVAVGGGLLLLGGESTVVALTVAILFWAAWWAQHQTLAINKWTPADIGWLSALALAFGYQWLRDVVPPEFLWPVLGAIGVALTLTTRLHQVPTLTYLSQIYFLMAVTSLAGPLAKYGQNPEAAPAHWQPALLIAFGLVLIAWWQRTRALRNEDFSLAMRLIDAAAVVTLLYLWIEPRVEANVWMLVASGLTLALSAYGLWRREWLLATLGQALVWTAVLQLFWRAGTGIDWPAALFPTATIIGLAMALETLLPRLGRRLDTRRTQQGGPWFGWLLRVATGYRIVAVFLGVRLINAYVPDAERGWVFALLGVALLAANGWRMHNLRFLGAALYWVIALGRWMNPYAADSALHWPNWLALALILAAPTLTRRVRATLPALTEAASGFRLERRDWEAVAIFCLRVFGVFALWVQISRLVAQWWGTSYLTIAWALTALVVLGGGFAVRERLLRWLGLIILTLALIRFLAIDLWSFDTLYRVVSAGAMATVFLLLAFLYAKYAPHFKKWL